MTESIEIYGFGDSDRSGKVRWLAAELGLGVVEKRVGLGEHRAPAYKALNPFGQIPTAVFRGETFVESTAICQSLAEAFDQPKLWIGRGEPNRKSYLFWLSVFGESLEGRLVECAVSRLGLLGPEYFSLHQKSLEKKLGVVAGMLPEAGHLCGEAFTVADVLAGYNLRLALTCELVDRAAVEPYFGRLVAREAARTSRIFAAL